MSGVLYQHVTNDLLDRLRDDEYGPGAMLPSEAELCVEYGVSRITIRSAIAQLVDRGLLVRRRGIGTFVTGRAHAPREFNLVGFLEETRYFTSTAISSVAVVAEPRIAEALALAEGAQVRHIRTLVHNEDEPFTIADSYSSDVPEERISEEDYALPLPSANAMAMRLKRKVDRAEQVLEAVAVTDEAAKLLAVEDGTPVIRARRVYYTADNRPIYYLEVRYHPARYTFNVDLVLRNGASGFGFMPDFANADETK